MPTLRVFRPILAGLAVASALSAFATAARAQGPVASDEASRARMALADKGRIQGSEDAKLWIVVFSDFQCPYCKRWHDATDATIRKQYVQTGKARLAFINFPLASHRNAQPSAEAAMCASAMGKFWPYHDALFASQDKWVPLDNPAPVLDSLASTVGLDAAQFRACRSTRQMELLVDNDQMRGAKAGAQGTPHFFIGTQQVSGAVPTADMVKVIDAELAKLAGAKK